MRRSNLSCSSCWARQSVVERCAAAGRLCSVDTGTGDQQTLGSGSTPRYNKVLLTFNLYNTVGGLNSTLHSHIIGGKLQLRVKRKILAVVST